MGRLDSSGNPPGAEMTWQPRSARSRIEPATPYATPDDTSPPDAAPTRDWRRERELWIQLLERRTGLGVEAWNRRIRNERFADEADLRRWLVARGVIGYAQSLLVMERFGYPEFILATADELLDAQYHDRPSLRPILDAVVATATTFGPLVVQVRKTYVSLVAPRRTFARVQPTTRDRMDLMLRLEGQKPSGRLQLSLHETLRGLIAIWDAREVDQEVTTWLERAYLRNA